MRIIRPLAAADWDGWIPLWVGYLDFYREELPDETTRSTFERLCDGTGGLFGLLALDDDRAIGLANCVVHATTWSRQPRTYLQDLFVSPAGRGGQVGHALLAAVKAAAAERGAPDVYWHTQAFNGRARSLYDQAGRLTSFVVYEM